MATTVTLNSTATALNTAVVQQVRQAKSASVAAQATLQLHWAQCVAKITDDNPGFNPAAIPVSYTTPTLEKWLGLQTGQGPTYFVYINNLNTEAQSGLTALAAYLQQVD